MSAGEREREREKGVKKEIEKQAIIFIMNEVYKSKLFLNNVIDIQTYWSA
jgi:hypothetical protein